MKFRIPFFKDSSRDVFFQWLTEIVTTEHPGNNIHAYFIGVKRSKNESNADLCVYLAGYENYDEGNLGWVFKGGDFEPTNKTLSLANTELNKKSVEAVQNQFIPHVRDFMATDTFKKSFLGHADLILTGCHDGDFFRLQ